MEAAQEAHKILDSMLGKLGFEVEIEEQVSEDGIALQISSEDSKILIGRHGERLDDIQYLVNRILQKHDDDAPRVKVDCDHFREQEEERLEEQARDLAEKVKESGKSTRMRPLNAYHRRIVHNALVDDEEVETTSPRGSDRLKRIEIRLRN